MLAPVVFALSWLAYAWTAAPAGGWLDSAEFVAASAQLGIAHPPGHPLPSLLGKALMLLPLGGGPWRVALASSLAGALAATALYFAAVTTAEVVSGRSSWATRLIAAAAAMAFALSGAAWGQSVRAEVYALEAALVLAALAAILRYCASGDRRALVTAGLATGLALANHHFVTLLFFLPAGAVALALRPGWSAVARTATLGVLGLGAFLYLPLRAVHDLEPSWGDPRHADSFVWTISAKAFQKSLGPAEPARAAEGVALALTEQIGLVAVGLALVGAYALLRRRGGRAVGFVLVGVAAAGAGGRALLGFEADNPDALGYLLPAQAALVVLAAAGLAAAARALRHRVAMLGACLLALAYPALRFSATSLRGDEGADAYGRAILEPLPARTLLVTSYFETTFQLWSLRAVEAARPDVNLLDRNLLTQPYSSGSAARRTPALAGLIGAPLRGGRPLPVAALDALAGERPVAVELAANLDDGLDRLAPWGPVARYAASPDRDDAERLDAARSAEVTRAVLGAADEDRHGAQRVLAWNAYLAARFYCALGRGAAGRAALARARAAGAAEDDLLGDVAKLCPPP